MPDEDAYRLDGIPICKDPPDEEIRTFEALELTVTVPVQIVRAELRDIQANAGNVARLARSDGGYDSVDQSDGQNTHTLTPPADRQDVRRQLEWVAAAEYDETLLEGSADAMQVELTLVPQESKRLWSGHVDDEPAANEWVFEFDAGIVSTPNPDPNIVEGSENGADQLEVSFYASGSQVRKVEESLRGIYATGVRTQPDGTPIVEDDSPGEVNTFYLDPPAGTQKAISPGWFVGTWYETEYLDDGIYQVEITALHKRDQQFHFEPENFGSNFDYGPRTPRATDV